MKREEIKGILENAEISIEDKINKIMDANGVDINLAKSSIDLSSYTPKADYESLAQKYNSLDADFSAYKESTKDYASIKEKYNGLLKENELNNKIGVLNGLNCKHSDLLVDKLDWSKYNQEKKSFDEEYIKGVKSKYSDLFDVKDEAYKPNKGVNNVGVFGNQNPNKLTMEDLRKL